MANIGFISLGCAKNQVDCERMMYRVQEAGFDVQPDVVGCDVVVINTCGFIDSAKAEAIDFILQMGQLKEYVMDVLRKLVNEIASGDVTANPYTRGYSHDACTFYPYGVICHKEDVAGRRNYQKMEADEFWTAIGKEIPNGRR